MLRENNSNISLSLSGRIAIMFGILTFFIVISFSILITTILRTAVLSQKSDELLQNTMNICHQLELPENQAFLVAAGQYIEDNLPLARTKQEDCFDLVDRIARQVRLPYYISYSVFYVSSNYSVYLGTNDPYLPLLPQTYDSVPVRVIHKNYYSDGDLNILYLTLQSGELYLQTALNMEFDSIDKLLPKLPIIVLFLSLPMLVISILMARFLSAQMLKPISEISRTAKEISGSNLDRRIKENPTHDELSELAHTFNLLFARLQSDFDRERQFTSDVSHELRTPLAVLLGHIDLLRRWGKNDEKVLNESLETLFHEAKSMQTLVENLLLLSRSERQKQTEKLLIRLNPLLEKMVSDTQLVSNDVTFEVVCAKEARLFTDPDVLTQVLRILVSNSIAYSPKPAHIVFIFDEKENSLTVKDNGNGIDKKDLSRVFERLYRADESRNRKTGGNGLGLAIAKTLVHNLNAKIFAESEGLGKGTSMKIIFEKVNFIEAQKS